VQVIIALAFMASLTVVSVQNWSDKKWQNFLGTVKLIEKLRCKFCEFYYISGNSAVWESSKTELHFQPHSFHRLQELHTTIG